MDPITMMTLMQSLIPSGSGASNNGGTTSSSGSGASGGIVSGLLDGLLGGVTKFIGCLGKQAWDTGVYNEALTAIDHAIDGIKTNADAERTLNDFSAILVSMPAHRDSMKNACTKENMNLYIDYVKVAKERLLSKFDVQEGGTGWWDAEGRYPHGEKKGNITLLRVIRVKGSSLSNSDLPINGGVGQNEYSGTYDNSASADNSNASPLYTLDQAQQLLANSSLTSSLSSSQLSSLTNLYTQLKANPNCRGGIKDGKPYLDCSVTNDNTQNYIQMAGLALTAVGLIYMMTKKKK